MNRPEAAISDLVAPLRATFSSGRTRALDWRRHQLERLRALLVNEEAALLDALRTDLGKGAAEAWMTEIGVVIAEVDHARRNLKRWARPERVASALAQLPARSAIERVPFGVVLVLAPWNYPVNLVLAPLVGALAAGNCVVLKLSEGAAATAESLARLIPEYLDDEAVRVVTGGPEAAERLLELPFDLIFFTGGPTIGRRVMEAAARRLTPVVLELGGKSPCIVADDADVAVAARRIAWGKFVNAGQTCVAPDYVLVERAREAALLEALEGAIRRFFGDDPRESGDYGRIVDARHHDRLVGLLAGGEVVCGGTHDASSRYLAPTVLTGVDLEAPLMIDEIFGPILPVVPVDGIDEAVGFIADRPDPLAMYVFSRSSETARGVLDRTTSGGACVNDVLMHLANPRLPFGGVGASGSGAYHGRSGFEAFSHRRSVLSRGTWIDPAVRYPPYGGGKLALLKRLFMPFGGNSRGTDRAGPGPGR